MKWLYSFIILLLFSVWGCSDNSAKPDQLINEEKYIDLMVELQLVRTYGESNFLDSLTVDSLTREVFNKYDVTDSTFVKSHNYYQQNTQIHQIRIEKAIERLKMDQVAEKQDTTDTETATDSLK